MPRTESRPAFQRFKAEYISMTQLHSLQNGLIGVSREGRRGRPSTILSSGDVSKSDQFPRKTPRGGERKKEILNGLSLPRSNSSNPARAMDITISADLRRKKKKEEGM